MDAQTFANILIHNIYVLCVGFALQNGEKALSRLLHTNIFFGLFLVTFGSLKWFCTDSVTQNVLNKLILKIKWGV